MLALLSMHLSAGGASRCRNYSQYSESHQRKLVNYLGKVIRVCFGDMTQAVHGNCPTVEPIDNSLNLRTTVGAHNAADGKFSMVQAVTEKIMSCHDYLRLRSSRDIIQWEIFHES